MLPDVGTERRALDASAALTDEGDFVLERGPLPAVLDTACVRTGLHFQLAKGCPPASVQAARTGSLRQFMEYDTLVETIQRLPRFANQLKVAEAELRQIFSEDWLPHIVSYGCLHPGERLISVLVESGTETPTTIQRRLLRPCCRRASC